MIKEFNLQSFTSHLRKLILFVFAISLFCQCSVVKDFKQLKQFQKGKYIYPADSLKAKLEILQTYPVIHLYGSPEEMGNQYGTILKPQLKSLFSILLSVFSQKRIDQYIQLGKDSEKTLPEKIKVEIRSVSEASDIDYNLLIAMNVATKVDCSTLAAWGESTSNGELIMGRNAEYNTKGLNNILGLIVVRHPNNGFASVNITYLGLVGGFSGINEKGVCYGNMLSYNGIDKTINKKGIPIQILLRLVSEKANTPQEFKNLLFENNYMIPNIVMSVNKDEAIISEHSQFGSEFRTGEKGILAATNFFHSQDLSNENDQDDRYSIIMEEVNNSYGNIDVETIKSIMHKARKKKTNVQCIIFEPLRMRMHVSMNTTPATKGPFKLIDAKALLNN